jgi:hypothetical protein
MDVASALRGSHLVFGAGLEHGHELDVMLTGAVR